MNPRPELAPRADGSSRADPEGRQHPRQRAAVPLEHEPRANADDARAIARAGGLLLPLHAYMGEKVRARRRVFGRDLVAEGSVIADGRSADEDRRRIIRGEDCVRPEVRGLVEVATFAEA